MREGVKEDEIRLKIEQQIMEGFIGHSEDLEFYSIFEENLSEVFIINGMIQFSSFRILLWLLCSE